MFGFSFKEIAAKAGIAETAAKLRSSRGIAQLRALLKGAKAQMTDADPNRLRARSRLTTNRAVGRCRRRVRADGCCLCRCSLTVAAAPVAFNVRADAMQLGWTLTWGVSLLQVALDWLVLVAALRESIPGRGWSAAVRSRGGWRFPWRCGRRDAGDVGIESGSCCSAAGGWSASSALADQPRRPCQSSRSRACSPRARIRRGRRSPALLGMGAGLMADAGWRMFCHFSGPPHVLSAHLGGVVCRR